MFEIIILFIFGICLGSFLNVCIYRLPQDKSIIWPASYCPKCNTSIKWYDNIPLLSYLFLNGKCRSCHQKISFRYFLVELFSGLLFIVFYLKLGLTLNFLTYIFLFCLLIVVSFIDIDYHAIPAYLCPIGIIGGLFFSLLKSKPYEILFDIARLLEASNLRFFKLPDAPFLNSIIGLLFGLGFTYLFKLFGDVFITILLYLRKKDSIEGERESLGLGDVDFMGMVGVFLGVKAVILVFFIAPFLSLIYSISALIFKKTHLIPYLPYLSLATLVTFFWGDKILNFIF
ncbi:MAG: prepilin peptidase [Candidatus Omnitrophica bacterium]|jgi:leader peptidase (prepilin peptidase)/N-methyltransferase|nr:prepilin peptidase [Candidatus Omnitrophota bacterium]